VIVTSGTQKRLPAEKAGHALMYLKLSRGWRHTLEIPQDLRDSMSGFMLRKLSALSCLALPLLCASSGAAQALDPEQQRAKAMLENLCGRCHAVGKVGKSPNPLAPQFRRFGEKLYDTDMVQRLQDGLTTIHPDMPTFRFNQHEAAAAVNYLRSIQKSR
jgi:mono/diheme cytochrome c family protein